MKQLTEGSTKLVEHSAGIPSKKMKVFYNPVKERDRSISVELVKRLKPKHCLDLLAASGARGIRLMVEAGVNDITFNDLNPLAVRLVKKNLKLNKLKARVFNKEANQLLYDLNERFDFIDLDPFGSPNPYLESAVKFTQRKGVLAVTATDTALLVGSRSKACYRKYHSRVVRHPFMKETGLRVLVKHVIEKGAEFDLAMKPVLAHSTAHYYRAYFIKDLGANRADDLLKQIKCLYYCPACGHRGYEPCNHKQCIELGPLYTGSLNSLKVLPELSAEDNYPPWHYKTSELRCKSEPRIDWFLKKYKAVRTHYDPKSFKTKLKIKR